MVALKQIFLGLKAAFGGGAGGGIGFARSDLGHQRHQLSIDVFHAIEMAMEDAGGENREDSVSHVETLLSFDADDKAKKIDLKP
jgi:hypothetical protein